MSDQELVSLSQQVLWASFAVALALGALIQRTGFCTMGAVSDAMVLGDYARARQWAMAAAVAMLGVLALAQSGQVDFKGALYATPRWAWGSAIAGGLLFGFGMVLASGCASKTLVRVGGGNLKALVVMVVLGVSSFATLKGITAVARSQTVDRLGTDLSTLATLPAVAAGLSGSGMAAVAVTLVVALLMLIWALRDPAMRGGQNLLAGLGLGLCVTAMWWVSGHLGHLAEHPQTLEVAYLATNSARAEAFSFTAPIAYLLDWLMFFSDKNKVLSVGIVSVLGVVVGAAVVAKLEGSFRWQGFADVPDLGRHLVGAALMGVGGVTALGCTVGHGLSGLSMLSLTSITAVAAIVLGGMAGVKYQTWALERSL